MARIVICNSEDKAEKNSSASGTSADSVSQRKLENDASNNETTIDVDVVENDRRDRVQENAPASERRVANEVTRLAQKFSLSASLADKRKKDPSPLPRPRLQPQHHQQLQSQQLRPHQQRVRKQINHQRCQQRAVQVAAGGGCNGVCRVRETVRLFEVDSNRVGVDRVSASRNGNNAGAGAQNHFRRLANNRMDTDANAISNTALAKLKNSKWRPDDGAVVDTATSVPSPTSVCEKREKIERRSSSLFVGVGDGDGAGKCEPVYADKKQSCAGAEYNAATAGGGNSNSNGQSISQRRCVSMLVKDTQTYASFDVRSLKNRPLSVAQHFLLESALNGGDSPTLQQPSSHRTFATAPVQSPPAPATAPALPPLSKNTSFLHRTKTSMASSQRSGGGDDNDETSVYSVPLRISGCDTDTASVDDAYGYSNIDELGLSNTSAASSSFLTSYSATATATATAVVSSTLSSRCPDDDDSNSNSNSNVYDTVLYSELCVVRPFRDQERYSNVARETSDGGEFSSCSTEAAYEAVSPLSQVAADADSDSNTDSSLEKTNSLYETKETTPAASASWFQRSRSQTAISTTSAANAHTRQRRRRRQQQQQQRKLVDSDDAENAATDNVAGTTATPTANTANSAGEATDDWLDINEWENASADHVYLDRIAIVKKRRVRINKLRKLKRKRFRSYQTQQKDSIESKSRFEEPSVGSDGDNFPEELCDDFDDTSSDENDCSTRKSHCSSSASRTARPRYSEKNFLPSVQSQNIYEFMKKARKTVRKSWSSFNQQMRKNSGVNVNSMAAGAGFPKKENAAGESAGGPQWSANEAGAKFGIDGCVVVAAAAAPASGSVRWTSFKSKLRPKYSTVSAANSSSIFYLNPEDLRFDMDVAATNETRRDGRVDAQVVQDKSMIRRRRTTCLDLNLTRPRPSSPPPPPPGSGIDKDKLECADENKNQDGENQSRNPNPNPIKCLDRDQNDVCAVASYAFHSPSSSSNSDLNLSSCSDLRLRFADEPLYQFYAESVAQRTTNASMMELSSNDSDGYEEIGSLTSRPSAMELITPSPNGHGQCRSLWCEVDEVKNSEFLEKLSIGRQKLQEAKFEVITSEASYYKSLSVLDKIFVSDARLRDENLVCKNDWKILFGNVAAVRKCSQTLLSDLENCWQEDIMLAGLSNVVFQHASTNFKIFVKYCSNQIYIDRTLKKLREESANFADLISKLEADPVCQSLSLHSFLMLPMQRITRMPLLVDAILSKLDPIADHSDYRTFKVTLAKLNKIVKDCNENARKFERYEEMLLVSRQLEFSRKHVKMFSVASSSRWLVRSGPLMYLNPPDAKLTITRKLTKNAIKLYFFLFNDILVIAKKKSEESYAVVDYCLRNVLQISSLEDTSSSPSSPFLANLYLPHRYLILATILENHEGKTVEMVLSCDSDSTRQRWLEACCCRLATDNPEEKLYEEWDCPQVLAVHVYLGNQPDELSLQNGDVVKVLKKTTDGWYHGERIRDGVVGWFPGNYTIEIASQHTRAKNLKLRHRLLTLSADYLQSQQQK